MSYRSLELASVDYLWRKIDECRGWVYGIAVHLADLLDAEGTEVCPLAVYRTTAQLVNAHTAHMRATTRQLDWAWIHHLSPRDFADAAIDSAAFRTIYAQEEAGCDVCHPPS